MKGNKYNGDVNLLRTCNIHSLDNLTDVPGNAVPNFGYDDGRFDSIESRLNSVATAVSKSSDVILDLHQVILSSQQPAGNDDSSSVSINSLRDYLDNNEDFRKAAQRN